MDVIKTFKQYSKMKIVFYMPEENETLVHELIKLGIFNIITESEVKELSQEIQMCLLDSMMKDT